MNHAPHPEVCICRLLASAHTLVGLAEQERDDPEATRVYRLLTDPRKHGALSNIIYEACHLATMDDLGYLQPYLDAMQFIYFTPEQAASLERALARWRDDQKGATDVSAPDPA